MKWPHLFHDRDAFKTGVKELLSQRMVPPTEYEWPGV